MQRDTSTNWNREPLTTASDTDNARVIVKVTTSASNTNMSRDPCDPAPAQDETKVRMRSCRGCGVSISWYASERRCERCLKALRVEAQRRQRVGARSTRRRVFCLPVRRRV